MLKTILVLPLQILSSSSSMSKSSQSSSVSTSVTVLKHVDVVTVLKLSVAGFRQYFDLSLDGRRSKYKLAFKIGPLYMRAFRFQMARPDSENGCAASRGQKNLSKEYPNPRSTMLTVGSWLTVGSCVFFFIWLSSLSPAAGGLHI